ncbi:MAG: redoxin domain-containing protein [Anaerolineales bacterium]|nr:redoxin domain-containing protein [Anaerolineales bacterium]MCB8953049.1 redoxin domain-containing protein [Ardenticatenales bacterium]
MQRWIAFQPEFAALGLQIVTISPDTPAEVAMMRQRDGLQDIIVLSDEELRVAQTYNLMHENAMTDYPKRKLRRTLMIPTTLLIGADGRVKWFEQTDDYRIREDADHVLTAVRQALTT